VWVTNRSDELWVGVKCQSNVEIARSPRNALRCSRGNKLLLEVEHCCCAGASPLTKRRQTPNASMQTPRVRRRVRTSVVKRETTQTAS
jgi:hypothetical protein